MSKPLRIDLKCPECGHHQSEAASVVSTVCQACGAHIALTRRKKMFGLDQELIITASGAHGSYDGDFQDSSLGPVIEMEETPLDRPSNISTPRLRFQTGTPHHPNRQNIQEPHPPENGDFDDFGLGEVKEITSPSFLTQLTTRPVFQDNQPHQPIPTYADTDSDTDFDDLGLGEIREISPKKPVKSTTLVQSDLFEPYTPDPTPTHTLNHNDAPQIGRRIQNRPSPYFKDAICFECGHKHQAGRNSRQSSCPNCGSEILLMDVEIDDFHTRPVLTMGDVTVHASGNLESSRIHCHNLKLYGTMCGPAHCEGDLTIASNTTLPQAIHCLRLIVHPQTTVTITTPIHTSNADIAGNVIGDIICHGPLIIHQQGSINGNISAYSVRIDPGGELLGSMNILRKKP